MSKIKEALDDFTPQAELVDERGPTTEFHRQQWVVPSDTGIRTVLQGPVERAVARGTLTNRQGLAARKLYTHWYYAGLRGTTGSSDPLKIFGTGMDYSRLAATEKGEAHWQNFRRAIAEVAQRADDNGSRKDHAVAVLLNIVCYEKSFLEAGQLIGFQAKAAETMARTILRSALNILIKRWNL